MRKPKSKFVKNKIRELKFSLANLTYIDYLMDLERLILSKEKVNLLILESLLTSYRDEFIEISKELNPKFDMSKYTKQEKKVLERMFKDVKSSETWIDSREREWVNLGGRI